MSKKVHPIDIEVDKLTNSIENAFSGDRFETVLNPVKFEDLKNISGSNDWKFDWSYEFKVPERRVYKLTIQGNEDIIQGLVSFSDEENHLFMHLIESAPFNRGKHKVYLGVAGNLIAFLCKESWDKKYEGPCGFKVYLNGKIKSTFVYDSPYRNYSYDFVFKFENRKIIFDILNDKKVKSSILTKNY